MPLMTPAASQYLQQATVFVHLTSRHKDVLHDGVAYEKSHSMVPSLATARREEKERRRQDCLVGLNFYQNSCSTR